MAEMLKCKLCGKTGDTVAPKVGACADCAARLITELARMKIDVVRYDEMAEYKNRTFTLRLFSGRKSFDASASTEMMAFADEEARFFMKVHRFIVDGTYAGLCSLSETVAATKEMLETARKQEQVIAQKVDSQTQALAELEDRLRAKKEEAARFAEEEAKLNEALNAARMEIGL